MKERLLSLVLEAVRVTNLSRVSGDRLEESPTARIFGRGSPLDSMGLVTLLLDLEELLRASGIVVTLTDDRAMSQTRSPFRSVPALIDYIAQLLEEGPCTPDATS